MIGLHVSVSGSLDLAFDRATEAGCTTFQIFTRNPRGWHFKPLTAEQVSAFVEKRRSSQFRKIVAHMPYLPNLASPSRATMKLSRHALNEEVKRCDLLGIEYLVTHLGSHLGMGTMVGVRNVAEACNEALGGSEGNATILLENMAGQKNCVGARFEELKQIIDLVGKSERVGVCLDSCHAYAAGFDLSSQLAVGQTMGLFEELVGYERLKVVHLNDSKGPLGSNLDRHENIGKGRIGRTGLKAFLCHPGILERPIIMETPYRDLKGEREAMAAVRRLLA